MVATANAVILRGRIIGQSIPAMEKRTQKMNNWVSRCSEQLVCIATEEASYDWCDTRFACQNELGHLHTTARKDGAGVESSRIVMVRTFCNLRSA